MTISQCTPPYKSWWLWSDPVGGRRRRAKALRRRPPRTNFALPSRPGSALRHREVADCPEVADSVDSRTCPQTTANVDGLRYSPDDPHYGFGPVHMSLYVWVTWDWWLGPRSPSTGEGGDWWSWPMGVEAEGIPRVCHRDWNNARIPGIPTISHGL